MKTSENDTSDGVPCTYVLVGGLVERDQVGVEASQTHHRPEGEEANHELQHREVELRKQRQMSGADAN